MKLTIDLRGLDREMKAFAKDLQSFPKRDNPLLKWRADYGLRTKAARRPKIQSDGTFRGSKWPKLKPAYKRKDGTVVPVWGGIPFARGKGTVKPRKRPDGSVYKKGDPQLHKERQQGLIGDWITSDPKVSNRGLTIRITSNKPYSARQADMRPFHWSAKIKREESKFLTKHVAEYIGRRLKKRIKR